MTLFAAQAAADAPAWAVDGYPRIPGWLADLLVAPRKDPAVRADWIEHAEHDRDQHVRLWLLEDRPVGDGPCLRRWHFQLTPASARWWFDTTTVAAGHRLVLVEVTP